MRGTQWDGPCVRKVVTFVVFLVAWRWLDTRRAVPRVFLAAQRPAGLDDRFKGAGMYMC